jgi:hypothetical protein
MELYQMGSLFPAVFSGEFSLRHLCRWLTMALVLGSPVFSAVVSAIGFDIAVQTTDCFGATGFASFNAGDLYKIQTGDCVDPRTGKQLQQILLKSDSGLVRYDVLWITPEEARNVLAQVDEINRAKIERLNRPDVVIERQAPVTPQANPGAATPPPPPPPSSRAREELPGPVIDVIDPPGSNSRSITNIITPASTRSRLVVGRIDAPAGLLSLTVNGRSQSVDEQGMFKTQVDVIQSRNPVKLLAVDKQGKQSSLEFLLLPAAPSEEQLPQSGESSVGVYGNYHALVLANNQYEKLDDLRTPINDADALAELLQNRYGFKVTRLNNANRYQLLSALNQLRRDLTDKDNLLIYYAGHGEYDKTNHRGHWLPVDAELDSTANWVSTVSITDIINGMSAKHVLVIADSCYSGALTRSSSTELDPGMSDELREEWLRAIAQTRSRYVLTSGGVKPVLDDSGNGHSVFANALLAVLQDNHGVLEGSKLFRDVKTRVQIRAEELGVDDSPQYSKLKNTRHEFGEFLLVAEQ